MGATALLALPALIVRRAHAAGTVTIAGDGEWFQNAFDPIVLGSFRKSHPGIGVLFYTVGNSFQMLGMLRGQRANPSIDVALMESAVATRATSETLFDPLTPENLPVVKELIPGAILPSVAGPALMLDSLALGYSPSQVPAAPRTWRNLWDPAYGRRIALQTPPDPLGLAITSVAATLFGGGGLLRSLEAGMTALTQLAPRVVLWDPVPDVYTAIAVGDAGIGPGWNARAQSQAAQTPGRFAANIPNEGSPVMVTTINLVKGSHQPAAARTLIAWLLGSEAQRLLTEALFFAPVNARAEISTASLARVGATPAMAARRMEMDWITVTEIRDRITSEWRRRLLGSR